MANPSPISLATLTLLGAAVMALGGMGPNAGLAALAALVLLTALGTLWRPGETPVLLLVVLLQWLQASIKVFYANWAGLSLVEVSEFGGDVVGATVLSLVALFLLTVGIRLGQGAPSSVLAWQCRHLASAYPINVWFRWYLIAFVASAVAFELAGTFPAFSQPLLALGSFKWAFVFLLGYSVYVNGGLGKNLWWLVVGFELILGFGGYFSDFKTVFFISAMALVAAGNAIRPGRFLALLVLGASAVSMAIVWTAVKSEYRNFLSGGQRAQIVTVEYGERMEKLVALVAEVDGLRFQEASKDLLYRISYVDFFSLVLDNVPAAIPHTSGAIWADAITRPFMPRVLFPNKTAIHDSERTAEFTGRNVSGVEQGTSISIGYVGETYIDFGAFGMMLPLFGFGYLLGRAYRWLAISGPLRGPLGMALACPILVPFAFLESSITKTLGGFVAAVLVVWLFGKFVAPRYLSWLLLPSTADQATPDGSRVAG